MGICWRRPRAVEDSNPLIVDVEKVISKAVWDLFYHSFTRWERMSIKRSDFIVEVPMNYYNFDKVDQEIKPRFHKWNSKNTNGQSTENNKDLLEGKSLAYRHETNPEQIGLETEFNNDTDKDQTYNFNFEKTRKATIQVTYQKGFSIGGRAEFTLGLPKILADGRVTTEINTNVQVSKSTAETFEETLTTSCTSNITVSSNSHYSATVKMVERNLVADFKVWVTMSMPQGEARAFVKNKDGETVFYYRLKNLSTLFKANAFRDSDNNITREDAVQFVIEGIVNGMQLSSHKINLVGQPAVKLSKSMPSILETTNRDIDQEEPTDSTVLKERMAAIAGNNNQERSTLSDATLVKERM